jgi:predicted metal-dependent hydrolase
MIAEHPSAAEITPRDIHFDVDPARVADWGGGDFVRTTFFNAMSILFPQGERFFISSVAAFRDKITDPKLQAEVKAFVMQEGLHTREHLAYNEVLAQIVDVNRLYDGVGARIAFMKEHFSPLHHLAVTCALEHFTAIMAHEALQRPEYLDQALPSYRALWAWHALEECEHKSVAFDVYRLVTQGKSEWLRRRQMAIVTVNFLRDILINCYHIFKARNVHRSPVTWAKLGWFVLGKPGFLRNVVGPYLKYYKRDFHPSQIDDRSDRVRAQGMIAQYGAPAGT